MRTPTSANPTSRRPALLAAATALALLLAACGEASDDTGTDTQEDAAAESGDAAATDDATSDADADASADDGSTDAGDDGDAGADDDQAADDAGGGTDGASGDAASDDPFCQELAAQQEELSGPDSPLLALDDPASYLEAAADLWSDLAAVAPAELADAVQSGQDAVQEVQDSAGGEPDLDTILTLGTDPDYLASVEAIGEYGQSACGIDLTEIFIG